MNNVNIQKIFVSLVYVWLVSCERPTGRKIHLENLLISGRFFSVPDQSQECPLAMVSGPILNSYVIAYWALGLSWELVLKIHGIIHEWLASISYKN